jgi:DNA-binding NarL/FixJ family response regulator
MARAARSAAPGVGRVASAFPGGNVRPAGRVPNLDTIAVVNSVPQQVTVLVYSNSADVRANVRTAVGRRPAPDVGRIDWVECATQAEVMRELDQGGIDVAIVDGEAQPTGGMGLARQFKYELSDCPPIVVLIARKQDGWLASWSLADAVINTPIEPVESAAVVAEQLRRRVTGIPVVR